MSETGVDGRVARELALSLRDVLRAVEQVLTSDADAELPRMISEHIGCPPGAIPNVLVRLPSWEHANLQRGVDAYLAEHSPDAAWFGVAGMAHVHQDLVDMLAMAASGMYRLGAVDYISVAVGPDRSMDAVQFGMVRTVAPDGTPVVIAVRGVPPHSEPVCALQVLAADRHTATAVRERVEALMREHDVFRGQVLTFGFSEFRGNQLVTFQPRPALTADQVVLPDGVLEVVERHVVLAADRAERLRRARQHLKRGLLLHGPPGTGKTHTVRYLMSRLTGCTVVVVSGPALMMIGEATALARRLQPSVVVVEDVDLIAEDRSFTPRNQPLLFQLLNEMDGVGSDADVTFVLTTNRVEVLEHALTDRPGRVDLAVEIPRPAAAARERLLRLYASGVSLDLPDAGALVAATDGVTASFLRELIRRAVLRAIDAGSVVAGGSGGSGVSAEEVRLDEPALRAALDELFDERQALTRSVLGGRPGEPPSSPDPYVTLPRG
jgi:ATPase family associated with various cellular activities (AAA)